MTCPVHTAHTPSNTANMSPPSKNRGRHPSHPPPPQLEQLQQSAGQSLPQPGQQQPVQQGVNQLQKAAAYNNQARPERTSAVTTASGTNTPGAGASGQGQVELGDAATFMDKVKVSRTIIRLGR